MSWCDAPQLMNNPAGLSLALCHPWARAPRGSGLFLAADLIKRG